MEVGINENRKQQYFDGQKAELIQGITIFLFKILREINFESISALLHFLVEVKHTTERASSLTISYIERRSVIF